MDGRAGGLGGKQGPSGEGPSAQDPSIDQEPPQVEKEQAQQTGDPAVQQDSPTQLPARLTSADLRSYLARYGLRASVVPEVSPDALSGDTEAIVKSIVLVADGSPLLVVVRGDGRVDERKVADLLKVARRRVRLARPDEVLRFTGFAVGTVPPFGHARSLRTFVDVSVTRLSLVYGGGGDPDMELRVAVPDLLLYTRAVVADVADGPALEPASAQPSGAALPLPWPRGSESVSMVAVVAQRRRIAKLLQFANLVPEQVPGLPPDGQAVYLRRLWRNPDTGAPVEVQLIMGKTLERNFGREQAQALLDQVKVGCVVAITGRVQPHRVSASASSAASAGAAAAGSGAAPAPTGASPSPPLPPRPAPQQQRSDVLDVVCHSVTVLHKSKDHLTKALRAAKRAGLGSPSTAQELLRLQQQASDRQSGLLASDGSLDGASSDAACASTSGQDDDDSSGDGFDEQGQSAAEPPAAQSPGPEQPAPSNGNAPPPAQLAAASVVPVGVAADGGPAFDGWRMPLPASAIRLVCNAGEVDDMRREVLGEAATVAAAAAAAAAAGLSGDGGVIASSSSPGAAPTVVGLDCEWEPYERHQPKTPVSILQVATRSTVYIVDLLHLLGKRPSEDTPLTPGHANLQPAGRTAPGAPAGLGPAPAHTEGAAALSGFLSELMSSDRVIKLGFQLASDLDRLRDSYPDLPCFSTREAATRAEAGAGAGSVPGPAPASSPAPPPTRSADPHPAAQSTSAGECRLCFDTVDLARRLRPDLGRWQQPSLSRLVELVLGKPLDKAQQRSAWGRRPLSGEQLLYAATDAYCLVALFDALLGSDGGGDYDGGGAPRSARDGAGFEPVEAAAEAAPAPLERALEVLGRVPPAMLRLPAPLRARGRGCLARRQRD